MTERQKYRLGNLWRIAIIVIGITLAFVGSIKSKHKMCPQCRRDFRETYLHDTTSVCPRCGYDFNAVLRAYEEAKAKRMTRVTR